MKPQVVANEDPGVAGSARDARGEDRDRAATRRDEVGDRRDLAGAARDLDSATRDAVGERRDRAADKRDRAADARDRSAEARDRASDTTHPLRIDHRAKLARRYAARDRVHAARDRHAGADDRITSEHDRTTSLADRDAGGAERAKSEMDRAGGVVDRLAAADDRATAALDELTGARSRGSGLIELAREMARAERTSQPLTLAYVDVDHLKVINDSYGHAAGDDALVSVVEAIRRALRSYDVIVRLGGDEFLCVLPGQDGACARTTVSRVSAVLAADGQPSVTFGIAELRVGESPPALIGRADADLRARRQERGESPRL